jgi:hypothetical protein
VRGVQNAADAVMTNTRDNTIFGFDIGKYVDPGMGLGPETSAALGIGGGGTQGQLQRGDTPPTWAEAGPAMRAALTGQPMTIYDSWEDLGGGPVPKGGSITADLPGTDIETRVAQEGFAGLTRDTTTGVPVWRDANGRAAGYEGVVDGVPVFIGTGPEVSEKAFADLTNGALALVTTTPQSPAGGGTTATQPKGDPVLDAQGNATNTPQAATTPQPQTVTQNSSESGGSSGGGGGAGRQYSSGASGGGSQRSYDYPRSSSKRGSSVGQMFADDGAEMDLDDFLKDYNGNGEVDEEDRRTAGKRFASYKKKRGRKGKTSTSSKSGFSNVPQREDSPIRTKTLNAIKTSTSKSKQR